MMGPFEHRAAMDWVEAVVDAEPGPARMLSADRFSATFHLAPPRLPGLILKMTWWNLTRSAPDTYRVLMRCCPAHVPHLIAAQRENDQLWMLFLHVERLASGVSPLAVAGTTGSVQRTVAASPGDLDGLAVLRIEALPGRLAGAVARARHVEQSTRDLDEASHVLRWADASRSQLAALDLRRVDALIDQAGGWAAELAASDMPSSLDHVDLTAANSIWSGGRLVILDWDEARWSCAALSMDKLMEPLTLSPPASWSRAARALGLRIKAQYLRSWGHCGSPTAWRCFDLAIKLAAVRDLDRVVTNLVAVGREHRVPLYVRAYLYRYRPLWVGDRRDRWALSP